MRILLVDTDKKLLKKTKEDITGLLPDAEILCHESSLTALAAARKKMIDIAFLEADMPELDGLLLGQYLRDLNPQINLIYFTDSPEHGYDALKLHASGYILKPAETDRMKEELDDLRHPVGKNSHKRVFAQTFGNFEFFVDGKGCKVVRGTVPLTPCLDVSPSVKGTISLTPDTLVSAELFP